MAVDLDAAKVQKLKAAGVSAALIRKFQLGQATPAESAQVNSVINGTSTNAARTTTPPANYSRSGGGGGGGTFGTPANNRSPVLGWDPTKSAPPSNGTVNRGGYNPVVGAPGNGVANRGGSVGTPSYLDGLTKSPSRPGGGGLFPSPVAAVAAIKPSFGSYGTTANYGAYENAAKKSFVDPDPQHNSWGGAYGTKEGAPGGPPIGSSSAPTAPGTVGEMPGAPSFPSVDIPIVQRNDFSAQANQMAADAYSPLYSSLANAKTNASNQASTNDAVLKGLYGNLQSDIQSSGVQQAQQYDQSGQDAAARSKALQDRINQIYGQSAQDTSNLAGQLGQQGATGNILQSGANQNAFQQSEAATQGAAQQDYYAAGKQNQQDYTTGVANAAGTAGTVARENLIKDLSNVLASFDSQEANAKKDQATTGLDIAGRLSTQDLDAQQVNASNYLQGLGLQGTQAQAAYDAQMQAFLQANQQAQQQYTNQRGEYESNRDYELRTNQFKLDAQTAAEQAAMDAAKARGQSTSAFPGSPTGDFKDAPIAQQISGQAEAIDPSGPGQRYLDLVNEFASSGIDFNNYNPQNFATQVAQLAGPKGLAPAAAYNVALEFWGKILNRK